MWGFCYCNGTMPDGFEPHTELQRIYNLREMMQECRGMWPQVKKVIEDALNDPEIYVRLKAAEFVADRGFGKPRQHVLIAGDIGSTTGARVLILPDNQRRNNLGPVIDSES